MRMPAHSNVIAGRWRKDWIKIQCYPVRILRIYTRRLQASSHLLENFYAVPDKLELLKPTGMRVKMDIVFIGAIVAFFALTCAFAAACGKLGGRP